MAHGLHNRRVDRHTRPAWNGKAVLGVLLFTGVAAFLLVQSTRRGEVQPAPAPRPVASLSVRDAHAHVAVAGILGGARQGQEVLARLEKSRPVNPGGDIPAAYVSTSIQARAPLDAGIHFRTAGGSAIRLENVRSRGAYRTREDAAADAAAVARSRLQDVLRAINPPVDWLPEEQMILKEYVPEGSIREIAPDQETKARWAANGLETDRFWIEMDVEVSQEQLRSLRSQSRLLDALWYGGALFGLAIVGFVFFKLDSFTKGYLTVTLAIVALVVVSGLIVALILAR